MHLSLNIFRSTDVQPSPPRSPSPPVEPPKDKTCMIVQPATQLMRKTQKVWLAVMWRENW